MEDQSHDPVVHISYECVLQERVRESDSYVYEIACGITYPATTGHLSLRVMSMHSYRRTPIREIPFTRHETGATTYVELLEGEQLEVRIVTCDGTYHKVFYYTHGKELLEQYARRIISTIQQIQRE
ncbi:hypothetical protein KSX_70820 [Ktedonospora formicarum]|uniref:Uncharacterized protein n=1 Tax=Ktedonospora formicarum TaxID=2778364 RepID=A0A8J3IBA6_9CHLR|nr:hypothetical protein KSX_70820 [Ktedonospora formicarum]